MFPVLLFWVCWSLIIYAYIIFPLLLALWACCFGKNKSCATIEKPNDDRLPNVAMVVSAYNEAAVLTAKLANTWAIDYPRDRFSLVIGSDGSTDATNDILADCNDARLQAYPFPERRGKISVLNELVDCVRTGIQAPILIMSDANTMFEPDAVRRLVGHFKDPRVACVSGELRLEQGGGVSGEGLYWKYENWIKRNESQLGFLIGCNGGIFALRSSAFEPLPASVIVEDFVITLRLLEKHWLVLFDPQARASEPPCPSSKAEMVRKIRIGAGNFQALTLTHRLLRPGYGFRAFAYWGHKVLRWLVPLLFFAALTANCILLDQHFYRILLLLQLCGGGIAAWSYNAVPGSDLPKWTRPISYFYLMNYALFCGFFRFLFRTQRVTWEKASR